MRDELENMRASTTGAPPSGRAGDLARYSRPDKFTGNKIEFMVWDVTLRCYVGAIDPELLSCLKASAGSPISIKLENGVEKNNAMQVFNILALGSWACQKEHEG